MTDTLQRPPDTEEAPPKPGSDGQSFTDELLAAIAVADPVGTTVHQRIIWCQGLIGAVGKTGRQAKENYSYRRIDDVMNNVHLPLVKAGLYIKPIEVSIRVEEWKVWSNANREFWVEMNYEITAPDGTFVAIPATGNAIHPTDKGVAAAKSYAYKQMLSQLFSLPTDDPAMDVEHTTYTEAPRHPWWHDVGWKSEAEHVKHRTALMADSRLLPPDAVEQLKAWAEAEESLSDGVPLYDPERRAFAGSVSPEAAQAWRDQIEDLKAAHEPLSAESALIVDAATGETAAQKADRIVAEIEAEQQQLEQAE